MPKYLISFEKGAMDHIPEEDFPAVGKAARAVCQEAKDAGVFVFAGSLTSDDLGQRPSQVVVPRQRHLAAA
jgi:hypothetical protein